MSESESEDTEKKVTNVKKPVIIKTIKSTKSAERECTITVFLAEISSSLISKYTSSAEHQLGIRTAQGWRDCVFTNLYSIADIWSSNMNIKS